MANEREGISLIELTEMFPDEAAARAWFEERRWPGGDVRCPRCESGEVSAVKSGRPMPWRCRPCRRYFSVRVGGVMEQSKLPLRKWVFAIYLEMTSLKGVSSMKLHRDLGISQKSAWFLLHRIREAFQSGEPTGMAGPVEADETYVGGKRKNMPLRKRAYLTSRGWDGKVPVAGTRDRATKRVAARVVPNSGAGTLRRFVTDHAAPGAAIYTDGATAYRSLPNQGSVQHGVFEYVRGQVHTNGIESFWSMLKRGYVGTYHKISPKHLDRYVREFAGRHNVRGLDTIEQMGVVAAGMVGRRLTRAALVADNWLSSGARSAPAHVTDA